MNFGEALEALKNKLKVAREGWNGDNVFLVLNGGYEIPENLVRDGGHTDSKFLEKQGVDSLVISYHIDMWTSQKSLSIGWLPSQTDMLAEDWAIVG
jgi:hypothetical protein